MEDPVATHRNKVTYMGEFFDNIEECNVFLKENKLSENKVIEKDIVRAALLKVPYAGCYWFLYNLSTETNPNKNIHIEKDNHIPVRGEYFINPKDTIDPGLERWPKKIVHPDIGYIDYVFNEDGTILKNDKVYIKENEEGTHLTISYMDKNNHRYKEAGVVLWELFSNIDFDPDKEAIEYINGNFKDLHILNLRKVTKSSGKREVARKSISTGKIDIFPSLAEAKRQTNVKPNDINYGVGKKKPRDGYLWYRPVQKAVLAQPTGIKIKVSSYTALREINLSDIAEKLSKEKEISMFTVKNKICNAANTKDISQKLCCGYIWDDGTLLLNNHELEKYEKCLRTNNIENNKLYKAIGRSIDPILRRHPLCLHIGRILYYETGHYKIDGDSIIRPRSIEEIGNSILSWENKWKEEDERLKEKHKERIKEYLAKEEEISQYRIINKGYLGKDKRRNALKKINGDEIMKRNRKLEKGKYKDDLDELKMVITNPYGSPDNKTKDVWRLANIILGEFGTIKNIDKTTTVKCIDGNPRNCHVRNLVKEMCKRGRTKKSINADNELSSDS
jgi:hypothetical protein